jgi:hypothetical protein
MAGGLGFFGLAAAGAIGAAVLVLLRRPKRTGLAVIEVPLSTLRAVVLGMEVAASALVRRATVECLGDYRRDPSLLVVEVQTATEADANRLIAEGDLPARLHALLRDNAYPPDAIGQVGLTIRSRERLEYEAAALREQEDLARWAED